MANFRNSRDGPKAQTETSEDFLPAMGTATGFSEIFETEGTEATEDRSL
jgi:hypothetical protein